MAEGGVKPRMNTARRRCHQNGARVSRPAAGTRERRAWLVRRRSNGQSRCGWGQPRSGASGKLARPGKTFRQSDTKSSTAGGWLGRSDLFSKRRVMEDTEGEALRVLPFSVLQPCLPNPTQLSTAWRSRHQNGARVSRPAAGAKERRAWPVRRRSNGQSRCGWGQPRSGASGKLARLAKTLRDSSTDGHG
jgi:hypothetical protein